MCVALYFGNTGENIAISPSYHNLLISNIAKEKCIAFHIIPFHETFSSNHAVKFAFVSERSLQTPAQAGQWAPQAHTDSLLRAERAVMPAHGQMNCGENTLS